MYNSIVSEQFACAGGVIMRLGGSSAWSERSRLRAALVLFGCFLERLNLSTKRLNLFLEHVLCFLQILSALLQLLFFLANDLHGRVVTTRHRRELSFQLRQTSQRGGITVQRGGQADQLVGQGG